MTAKEYVQKTFPNAHAERHLEGRIVGKPYWLIRNGRDTMYIASSEKSESNAWAKAKKSIIDSRIKKANELIEAIANRGRKFFYHEGNIAYFLLKGNTVYMKNEFSGVEMSLSTKTDITPKGWHHGSTLLTLALELRAFILHGDKTVFNCKYWGYSEEDINFILEKAKSLGIHNN